MKLGSKGANLPEELMILVNEGVEINNPENLQMVCYSVDRAYTKNLFSFIKNEN